MDLLDEALAELTDARRLLTDHGGGHPNAYTRAAQIAVVAQAEAAHRQAAALERIANALDGSAREFSIEAPDKEGRLTIRYPDGTCAVALLDHESWRYRFLDPATGKPDGGQVTITWEGP